MIQKNKLAASLLALPAVCLAFLPNACQISSEKAEPVPNLVVNPGFEEMRWEKVHGWDLDSWIPSEKRVLFETDASNAREGARSMKITHFGANDSCVLQLITVRPDSVYRISGWIKTEKVEPVAGRGGASLFVYRTPAKTTPIKGTSGWMYQEMWVKTASDQSRLVLTCRLGEWGSAVQGQAWFDDIAVRKFDDVPHGAALIPISHTTVPFSKGMLKHTYKRIAVYVVFMIGVLYLMHFFIFHSPAFLKFNGASGFLVFFSFVAVYSISSALVFQGPFKPSPYPHYVYLAEAFLNKRLHLVDSLYEMAVVGGKYYVVEPLFPALLAVPFFPFFGKNLSDVFFLIVVGALNVSLVHSLCKKLNVSKNAAFWLTILFGLGTPHWYLSVGGRVWHTESIVAQFCLLLAVHETFGRRRPFFIGLVLGWAFLSHPASVFSLPFFLLMLYRTPSKSLRPWLTMLAPLCVEILVGWGLYNYLRFGHFFETGLSQVYASEVEQGLSKPYGLMNIRYIAYNFYVAVLRLPLLKPSFPFLHPDGTGFGLFYATPAFLLVFLSLRRNATALASGLAFLSIFLFVLSYHVTGANQFGYRYILNTLPFLMILMSFGMKRVPMPVGVALIGLSVVINFWGVIWFYAYM